VHARIIRGDHLIAVDAAARRRLTLGRKSDVPILVTTTTVTVISKTGHHVLSSHHIDPDRNYWRNQNKNPGQRPGNG
jgi:hypothetical protein